MDLLTQRTKGFFSIFEYPLANRLRTSQGVKYKPYTLKNFRQLPQIQRLSEEQKFEMEVVGQILPFKTNNYVVEELIDWDNIPHDPMFILTFPQRNMLKPHHYNKMAAVLKNGFDKEKIRETAEKIRSELNPNPAGQMEHNIPSFEGKRLSGMQHKYKETVLFFPRQGQTCHAYCTFCFRWPQFVGTNGQKFAMRETELLLQYVHRHPKVSDILITGGDPLIMKTQTLASYIEPLLAADIPHLKTIRIGTKALAFWPHRFLTDPDAEELLALFRKVTRKGLHLTVMAHFNHPQELKTEAAQKAISQIQETGVQIRTQSPLLAHINDKPEVLAEMWREQVRLGCIPYYMFVARDTGSQHFFGVPLVKAWKIFRKAYQKVTGLSRTVRGPSMSATSGKVQILGVSEINGEKVIVMRFLQARKPDWVQRPFFAEYDPKATWLSELKPAFGQKKFFFEENDSNGDDGSVFF